MKASIVESWALTHLKEPKAKRNGEWIYLCPLHAEENPSFALNPEKGVYKCFICGGGSVKELAERLGVDPPGRNGLKPVGSLEAVYPYTDEAGAELFQGVRFKDPKSFRQRRSNGRGGWVWSLKDVRRVLYHLPEVRAAVEAGSRVFIAEGEKDVDRLRGLGLVATCNPMGAGKWETGYTEALRGAVEAVILPDHDRPGMKHAKQVANSLHAAGIPTKVVPLFDGDLPENHGPDVSDWLADGHTLEDLSARVEAAPGYTPAMFPDLAPDATPQSAEPGPDPEARLSKVEAIYTAMVGKIAQPFRAQNKYFAVFNEKLFMVEARPFRGYLRHEARGITGGVLSDTTIKAVQSQILAHMEHAMTPRPPEVKTGKRVLESGGKFFLRLDEARAAALTPNGVEILPALNLIQSGAAFLPDYDGGALPLPAEPDGTGPVVEWFMETAGKKLHEDDAVFVLLWLLSAFIPIPERPALYFHGPQGAGKSMLSEILKNLIDPPSVGLLSSPPQTPQDAYIIAANQYLVAVDNIGGLSSEIQDAFSSIITGTSFKARELYTVGEMATITPGLTCFVFNGLSLPNLQNDLVDRIIPLEVRHGSDRDKAEIREDLATRKPAILGSVFQTIGKAMTVDRSKFKPVSRFTEWERWVYAIAEAAGVDSGRVRSKFKAKIDLRAEDILEADDVARTIRRMVTARGFVEGTADGIYKDAKAQAEDAGLNTGRGGGWPQSPHAFGCRLTRIQRDLSRCGFKVEKKRTNAASVWGIYAPDEAKTPGNSDEI